MRYRWLLLVALTVAIACGKSTTSPTSGSNGGTSSSGNGTPSGGVPGTANRGTVSATIDGVSWSGTVSTATVTLGSLAVAGENTAGLIVGFGAVAKTGTTSVGLGSGTNGTVQQNGRGWHAMLTNGSGSVTITTLTASGASGTFSFTMVPLPNTGATGNRVVTNGAFNVTF
jgi:hypothetical protein